jgi:arylsulfatase A-like enzyme
MSTEIPRTGAVRAAAVFLAVLAGCGGEPAPDPGESLPLYDLAARFAAAEVLRPTTRIDFGTPASRAHLVRGWADGARELEGPGGGVATWSVGDAAEIEIFVAAPADVEVKFRCAPVGATRGASRRLTLEVNGEPWQHLEMHPRWADYRLPLPAKLQRSGQNRLRIVHPPLAGPAAAGFRVAWESLEILGGEPREPAMAARAQDGIVFIPFDTRVDYYLELPGDSVLSAEQIRGRGASGGRLSVSWQAEDGGEQPLSDDLAKVLGPRLPISEEPARGRLSLLALADGGAGVDEAGIVLRRPAVLAPPPPASPDAAAERAAVSEPPPNVVIYLVDTLRADHLGCYGYDLGTSPELDRFAEGAFLFENAQAQSPWTRPSVASIFTGLWPQVHGTNGKDDALPDVAVTLAEMLHGRGYRTAAVTSNGNAHRANGFAQGFDHFEYLRRLRPGEPIARASDVHQAVVRWLDGRAAEQPFFLWVHTVDPHAPYEPPEPFRSRFAGFVEEPDYGALETIRELNADKSLITPQAVAKLVALYDAEVAANDAAFGQLLEELRGRGLYDGSLIVFVSDHGEEFYDHGDWVHGKTLHAEMLDVPLVVKLPGASAAGRVPEVVQHVDIPATVLDVLGLPVPSRIQGRSLVPLMRRAGSAWTERAVAYLDNEGRHATSLVDGSWKLIQPHEGELDAFPRLFDRRQDRREYHNLAPERSTLAKFLAASLRADAAARGEALAASDADPEEMRKLEEDLRALGYLE